MQELSRSLDGELRTLKNAEAQGDKKGIARSHGRLGGIYLSAAKLATEPVQNYGSISTDKKINLTKAIDYCNKSADEAEAVGDIDQMRTANRDLYAAQKMNGNVKDAMATYTRIQSLKLNGKKAKEIEIKQVEYEHQKREDSIRKAQQMAEERLREQSKILNQQQQQLLASNQSLTASEKEKQDVSMKLQKTQADLTNEKTVSEEKTRQLTQAEAEAALQAANLELQQNKMQRQRDSLQLQKNELDMKDKALEERRKEQIFYVVGIVALLAVSLLVFRNFRVQKKYNMALVNEKKRSEELLLNILPAEVAEELMQKGFTDAKHFYDVTVLFTDFVNFTSVAETMLPQQLVGELHVCFKAFDMILSKYRIEKIKTVGDAYMAVSGLPVANPNHATDIAAAALEIRDFMAKRKMEMGNNTFGIRIGINSGNVVAGIVGVRKFAYDIWGDTVNIAARLEQNSEEGRINISEATYQLVKDKYLCEPRGKVVAKNKGNLDMYYLVGAASQAASADEILTGIPRVS
jgi:adenylate cyclase